MKHIGSLRTQLKLVFERVYVINQKEQKDKDSLHLQKLHCFYLSVLLSLMLDLPFKCFCVVNEIAHSFKSVQKHFKLLELFSQDNYLFTTGLWESFFKLKDCLMFSQSNYAWL